jgi:hypothetical protein
VPFRVPSKQLLRRQGRFLVQGRLVGPPSDAIRGGVPAVTGKETIPVPHVAGCDHPSRRHMSGSPVPSGPWGRGDPLRVA